MMRGMIGREGCGDTVELSEKDKAILREIHEGTFNRHRRKPTISRLDGLWYYSELYGLFGLTYAGKRALGIPVETRSANRIL